MLCQGELLFCPDHSKCKTNHQNDIFEIKIAWNAREHYISQKTGWWLLGNLQSSQEYFENVQIFRTKSNPDTNIAGCRSSEYFLYFHVPSKAFKIISFLDHLDAIFSLGDTFCMVIVLFPTFILGPSAWVPFDIELW